VTKRFEAGGLEFTKLSPPIRRTHFHGLVAQTMAVFKQHHVFGIQILRTHRTSGGESVVFGSSHEKWLFKQVNHPQTIRIKCWCGQYRVEHSIAQVFDQFVGETFLHKELQPGKLFPQRTEEVRH